MAKYSKEQRDRAMDLYIRYERCAADVDWLQCIRPSDEGRMTWDWRPTMADPKHPRHHGEAFKRQIAQSCESGKPSREIGAGTTSRDRPRGAGPRHPRQRLHPAADNRTPGRNEPIERGGATGGWRWRWTFQNKRRRYSHEGRRDTGQRRPLPDIGAMRDTGRSPPHLLLDDRASGTERADPSPATCARSGATAANATAPGRSRPPRKGRASPRPRDASATSCANRACGRVRARTVRTAQDAGRRGRAREPAGPRVRRLRPAHASGGRSYLCPRRRRLGVRVSAGRPADRGIVGHSAGRTPGRKLGAGRVRHPRLPADGRPETGVCRPEGSAGPSSRILTLGDNSMQADRVERDGTNQRRVPRGGRAIRGARRHNRRRAWNDEKRLARFRRTVDSRNGMRRNGLRNGLPAGPRRAKIILLTLTEW